MDPMWAQLPEALVDMICNKLIKVRRIPSNLKFEIESFARYKDMCNDIEEMVNDNPHIGMGYGESPDTERFERLQKNANMLWHSLHCHKKWSFFYNL